MITDFSIELATGFVQSTEQYPVDFDRLWVWCGYSSKQKAKNKLVRSLKPKIDYEILLNQMDKHGKHGGHNAESIRLTTEAAKVFAMMANTPKGQEVREYFLDCEKVVKAIAQSQPQKAPAKILNRNYSSARKECCDQLKRHGATGKTYGAVEKYNNELSGIESGSRHELTYEQAHQVGNNYLFAAIELLKRDAGFNNGNQYHLQNTTKMGMRHGMYEQLGADSVPEKLKPKKERKQLKAS